jgi:recombination protein RecT
MAGPQAAAPQQGNGNGAALATAPKRQAITPYQKRVNDLAAYLEARKSKLAEVLPRTLTPERLVKIAIQAVAKTPDLLKCDPGSIYLAVHHAAQLGLEPGGPLGGAYLVPYKATCQLIVGYRGLIDLARRSGQILSIEARVVRDGDTFTLEYGLSPVLTHKPNLKATTPGELQFVYAVACLRDGGKQCEVMTRAEVDAIRNRSKASKSGPWVTDYEEMARKTVVRRLCKYLPLTVELARAFDADSDGDTEAIDVTPVEVQAAEAPALPDGSTTHRLAEDLKKRRGGDARPVAGTRAMTVEGLDEFEHPPETQGDDPAATDPAMAEGVDVGEPGENG